MDARRFAPLLAVALLILVTTCTDAPTPLSPAELSPTVAARCGTPPCGHGAESPEPFYFDYKVDKLLDSPSYPLHPGAEELGRTWFQAVNQKLASHL